MRIDKYQMEIGYVRIYRTNNKSELSSTYSVNTIFFVDLHSQIFSANSQRITRYNPKLMITFTMQGT